MTHKDLVEIGRTWLAKRCPIVITELSSAAGETPDIIGFEGRIHDVGYGTHLIECKTSRADFKADTKKRYRFNPDMGMGDYRYYLTPKGLLNVNNIPENWGLLEVHENGHIYIEFIPQRQEADKNKEISLLISTLRRLNLNEGCHNSIRIKSYRIETKNIAVMERNNQIEEGEEYE